MITPTHHEPSPASPPHIDASPANATHWPACVPAPGWLRSLPPGAFLGRRLTAILLHAALLPGVISALCSPSIAQGIPPTGPQALAFSGLSAGLDPSQPQAGINAAGMDAMGNLYLLLNEGDGVRLVKTDPGAGAVLAQAKIGAAGDIGLALALDSTGQVYVTGTTTSGALAATSGAVFTATSGSAINSFVARFDSGLHPVFLSFAGGGAMAASSIAVTSDAVFISGSIFSASLPVTPSAIIQAPAYGSTQNGNGFVEKFSADGSALLYATYLSGAGGGTTASAIAADSTDDAYIAGTTTSTGYPTLAAVVPEMLGATSGFLTKLTPAGDGITFSTYIPGAGIASLALDPVANNLLLTGAVSLGQFPVATASTPLTATSYQVLLRMSLDGSTVLGSTVLAPGTQSFVAPGAAGSAWVVGDLSLPVLPLTPLSGIGNSYAVHVNAAHQVDQTVRVGGVAASNPGNAGAPVTLSSVAVSSAGDVLLAGSFEPYASQALLATQTFDLPLAGAASAAFPSPVRAAVMPASACHGSLCAGSAAYLARIAFPGSAAAAIPALTLSVDDSPNLTLRNLGSAAASGIAINVTGFTPADDCGMALPAGGECSIALTGTGPGSITISATNAASAAATLPALGSGIHPLAIVFAPKELDFGIVSSASGTVTRTITVTNLTQQSQTFASLPDLGPHSTLPYTFAESGGDCTLAGVSTKLLTPGAVCHIVLGLTVSNSQANDGALEQNWKLGARDVQMTAYAQAAALSVSAAEIDFGTQYNAGLRLPRYLYLSNNSTVAAVHAAVTLPGSSPFSVTDACPQTLEPFTVCQIQLAYQAAHTPSTDSVSLSLDQGLSALVTGRTLPQPSVGGASVNPNLSLSATALGFPSTVAVTATSSSVQTVTLQNTGASAFALAITLTGDFTDTTNCGATLAGNSSCSVVLSFAPSAPGARQGLLSVTAGAGSTPGYVALSGTATAILSPANNGTLNFGGVIAGQPTVQWYKVTEPFTSFSASSASTTLGFPYTVVLVEDIGYGHGQPAAAAFATRVSSSCLNCWLGVRFTPPAIGAETGTLTLASSAIGSPYGLALAGYGLPQTGLLLTPVSQDFGPVAVSSVSPAVLFSVTNLTSGGSAINIGSPTLIGDFAVSGATSGGATCGGPLAYSASCLVEVSFAPSATGPRGGVLTLQAGSDSATAQLTGYGSPDSGIALSPTALVFSNVPSASSTLQSITLTNTGSSAAQIGGVTVSNPSGPGFSASSTCSALAPGATCSIQVSFAPSSAQVIATLSIPITTGSGSAPSLTTYSVPLASTYTTQNSGLQIVPGAVEFGPQATGADSAPHQFTLNNLTGKQLVVSLSLPRQFVLNGPTCASLAPSASCNFSVSFLPLSGADITGTLLAQATPADGSAALTGIGYLEGYGIASSAVTITGGPTAGAPLSFGQVPSGQSAQRTLTLVNTSGATLTIRRISSPWPFLSTTSCGATLTAGTSCTVTLSYTPLNQVAAGSTSSPSLNDTGTLTIESDAASSPDLVDLAGSSTALGTGSPSNAATLATLTPSTSSLSFAATPAGSASAPQTITLTNSGGATLTIAGIQTNPDFSSTSNCSTLLPGASCNLTVAFTPQQPGTGSGIRSSAVEISSNSATSLEFISLVGSSTAAVLTAFPESLGFATTQVGSTSILTLQLTNSGATPVTLTALTTTGDYIVSNGTCPTGAGTLAAGATCALPVGFVPTQAGTRSGTLAVANSLSSQPLIVPLSGPAIQSNLQIAPSGLSFGSLAVGSSTGLSLTLANSGSAPITGIMLAITGDYTVASSCSFTSLAPQASCSVTIAFAPTATGVRPGTLTVTSSDPTSPTAVLLSGTGTRPVVSNGSFTLTVNGSNAAASTVASGTAATYNLAVTPVNGFAGGVVLNCTPLSPATYATCSLLPSSVTLNGTAQSSVATLTTVASVASNAAPESRSLGDTSLCLFFPALIFTWKARRSSHYAWRVVGPVAWAVLASVALLTTSACGGNNVVLTSLRYAPAGTYQYQVTATSTATGTTVTQSVLLNLIVQ